MQTRAEGSVGDMFEGVALLEAGFSSLIDLETVHGDTFETFQKNTNFWERSFNGGWAKLDKRLMSAVAVASRATSQAFEGEETN